MKYGLPYKGSKNKLAERIVRLLPRADHLIDLFCGTTAIACIREHRHFIGFELNEEYYIKAQQRIKREQTELTLDFE